MAQFYASIRGNRSERTCMGSKNSGISGHIRGWNIGAKVWISHNDQTEKDEVTVYKTGGSNGATNDKVIAHFTE
jgi:hypothetical protein